MIGHTKIFTYLGGEGRGGGSIGVCSFSGNGSFRDGCFSHDLLDVAKSLFEGNACENKNIP